MSGEPLSPRSIRRFQVMVYRHYHNDPRSLPWRKTRRPYRILVSEIMLQQTRAERVREKYGPFLRAFPDFASLARAPLHAILKAWKGMGYNRRAIALKGLAGIVTEKWKGKLPDSEDELLKLPGIGKYSASAILAFALNKPTVFVETNIRRVFIHLFFKDREEIRDSEILPLVEKTLDRSNPRQWYYALMDYGVMLRGKTENPNRRSAHYKKQPPFEGSDRQVRGLILTLVLRRPGITKQAIIRRLARERLTIERNLSALQKEGFIKKQGKGFWIG